MLNLDQNVCLTYIVLTLTQWEFHLFKREPKQNILSYDLLIRQEDLQASLLLFLDTILVNKTSSTIYKVRFLKDHLQRFSVSTWLQKVKICHSELQNTYVAQLFGFEYG